MFLLVINLNEESFIWANGFRTAVPFKSHISSTIQAGAYVFY